MQCVHMSTATIVISKYIKTTTSVKSEHLTKHIKKSAEFMVEIQQTINTKTKVFVRYVSENNGKQNTTRKFARHLLIHVITKLERVNLVFEMPEP